MPLPKNKEFGKPAFCKIDVEGYEYKVIKGLSEPLNTVSFEFTPSVDLPPGSYTLMIGAENNSITYLKAIKIEII